MRLVQRIILFIYCALVVMAFAPSSYGQVNNQSKPAIKIVIDYSPPYIMEQNGKITGIATQIVESAFSAKQVSTDIKQLPWSDVKLSVDSEKVLSFWWHINKQREKSWLFSKPIYQAEYVFLARKAVRFYWTRFDQLRPYKIGLSHIQSYGEVFDSYIQYLNTEKTLSDFSAIKKLLDGQLDAILIEKSMAFYLMNYLTDEERQTLELFEEQVLHKEPYFLVCAKFFNNCSYYINQLNEGLKLLKNSGRYEAIIRSNRTLNEN